jgi:hypothetical protein
MLRKLPAAFFFSLCDFERYQKMDLTARFKDPWFLLADSSFALYFCCTFFLLYERSKWSSKILIAICQAMELCATHKCFQDIDLYSYHSVGHATGKEHSPIENVP